jgi:hypothetical protein
MSLDDESQFIKALVEINSDGYDELNWLKENYKLFKTTLVWPMGLPFISRSVMSNLSLQIKFHSLYKELLKKHPHKMDNRACEIIFI